MTTIKVTLPDELYQQLKQEARAEERSIPFVVRRHLQRSVDSQDYATKAIKAGWPDDRVTSQIRPNVVPPYTINGGESLD